MDPSNVQADSSNDVHSLEHEDGDVQQPQTAQNAPTSPVAGAEAADITDATGGTGKPAPPPVDPFKHRSFIKRLWDKFNIYLLLFALVMVLAIGSLVTLTIKEKDAGVKMIGSQELSQDALKQLANTDVTVGSPKQILTIQANAVFAGAALVRGDLEVAGTLKLGGDLSLANLNVSGASTMRDINATNLTVSNNLAVQGTLTLKSGISVGGQSNFNGGIVASSIATGALQLNGDLKLTNHITAGGTTPTVAKGTAVGSGGTVSISGSDTAGTVTINPGGSPPAGCFATITFNKAFNDVPHVAVTPVGSAAGTLDFYVTRTTTTLSICTANSASAGQSFSFDYIVLD